MEPAKNSTPKSSKYHFRHQLHQLIQQRKYIKELQSDLKTKEEEILKMKRSIKYTKI